MGVGHYAGLLCLSVARLLLYNPILSVTMCSCPLPNHIMDPRVHAILESWLLHS